MSIDPVATAQHAAAARKGASSAPAPVVSFEEVLARSADNGEVSPQTAAEVLRLRMLSSALTLAGEESQPPAAVGSLNVQGLLNRFLEQLPERAGAGFAGGTAEGVAEGAFHEMQHRFEAGELPPVPLETLSGDSSTEGIIERAAQRYGVDSGLIRAVIKAESDFNPKAVSSAGAQGLMQLMPATARGLGVSNSFDPEQNIMAGTRFLKDMLQRYQGNVDEALAAYNWGPGRVDKYGTTRLPRETRDYLAKVKGHYAQYVG